MAESVQLLNSKNFAAACKFLGTFFPCDGSGEAKYFAVFFKKSSGAFLVTNLINKSSFPVAHAKSNASWYYSAIMK